MVKATKGASRDIKAFAAALAKMIKSKVIAAKVMFDESNKSLYERINDKFCSQLKYNSPIKKAIEETQTIPCHKSGNDQFAT